VPNTVSRRLLIHGFFPEDAFSDWITRRANRLSLEGWVIGYNQHLIEVCMVGDKVLVEAMEVACSLGPLEAQIDHIDPIEIFDRIHGIDTPQAAESTTRHTRQFDGYSTFISFANNHVE